MRSRASGDGAATRGLRAIARATALGIALAASFGCATGGSSATGGAATSARGGGARADEVGKPAPEIVVQRLNGKPLALSSLRGKVVLLDVWASWCGPCKQELPMLDAIAGRLRGRGVEILAISIDQERDNVLKFLGSRTHWSLTVAHDPGGAIAETLQPDKMPTSYVIDRAGVIRYVNMGFEPSDAAVIEQRLAELAGESETASASPPARRAR